MPDSLCPVFVVKPLGKAVAHGSPALAVGVYLGDADSIILSQAPCALQDVSGLTLWHIRHQQAPAQASTPRPLRTPPLHTRSPGATPRISGDTPGSAGTPGSKRWAPHCLLKQAFNGLHIYRKAHSWVPGALLVLCISAQAADGQALTDCFRMGALLKPGSAQRFLAASRVRLDCVVLESLVLLPVGVISG